MRLIGLVGRSLCAIGSGAVVPDAENDAQVGGVHDAVAADVALAGAELRSEGGVVVGIQLPLPSRSPSTEGAKRSSVPR